MKKNTKNKFPFRDEFVGLWIVIKYSPYGFVLYHPIKWLGEWTLTSLGKRPDVVGTSFDFLATGVLTILVFSASLGLVVSIFDLLGRLGKDS